VPAGFGDFAGLLDAHDRTIEHFRIGIAPVILLLTERPFEGSASERVSWAGSCALVVSSLDPSFPKFILRN